jgi:5-methylcytosine-specific restriction endonuclease McrA
MNLRKAEAWIEAEKVWLAQARGVPAIVAQEVRKQAGKALAKARPYKAPVRLPRGIKAKVKRVSLPKLKKDLDRVFSLFIRRRDCHLAGGWGTCATCGTPIHVTQSAQASHYQVRQDMATRWDETNVHAACGNCNGFRGGEPEKMAAYIDLKYGEKTAERLRAQARQPFRLNRQWLEQRIKHYKGLIGEASEPASPASGTSPNSSPIPLTKGSL